MVKLIAETPCEGLLPRDLGAGMQLVEVLHDPIQWIAPYKGQEETVAARVRSIITDGLPRPNQVTGAKPSCLWVGPGQYLLRGAWLDGLDANAAVADQSDAWAVVAIEGDQIADVLARLVPIDLRLSVFPVGQTARTLVNHMPASVTRISETRIEVMVMRSMAQTLVHEISDAAAKVTAR